MKDNKKRNILLIEPNYKNKYPPIGLMKLSTYHKMLGDNVVFYKGELKDFGKDFLMEECISKLGNIDSSINWRLKYFEIYDYIFNKKQTVYEPLKIENSRYESLIYNTLQYYKKHYTSKSYLNEKNWDRICVTTLFTFYWDITIKTINFCKQIVKDENELWIGGVMASVSSEEIKKATGINNVHIGLLDKPGLLDNNQIIIDELALDYSILEEIEYQYPETNSYYSYTTRGCVRKCEFCAVPIIEPKFIKYVELKSKVNQVNEKYGEKRNLLLLDNNVLASPKFKEIISEIRESGFDHVTKYVEPNHLKIAVNNLKLGENNRGYLRKIVFIFNEMLDKLKGEKQQNLYNDLFVQGLLKPETASAEKILNMVDALIPLYEKTRNKIPKIRYVDFNQGIDARLLSEEKAYLLSQIPIRPLRIAFDSIVYKDVYEKAILNARKFGIKHFSNYLLYNFEDKPIELYQRIKLNVDYCEIYGLDIYSFPMKYHPIFGEYRMNRDYVGKYWNRKFIRAIQVILNATKGKIGKGLSFFNRAFGSSEIEFQKLLYMPETYLLFRFFFEKEGLTEEWWSSFTSLNDEELIITKKIIEGNDFKDIDSFKSNTNIYNVLKHYTISRNQLLDKNSPISQAKTMFDTLSREERNNYFSGYECL